MSLWIKVCGVTTVEDALAAIAAGVDAIGLNFVPASKRFLRPEAARELVRRVGPGVVTWVGVAADEPAQRLEALRVQVGLDLLQLHGRESPADLAAIGARAFKAVPIANAEDVSRAESFGGERLLLDAHVPGVLGGSGQTFDWSLVRALARQRNTVLAGGLTPVNVGEAVRTVRPFGVDVASGVESAPGRKDHEAMRRFVELARAAELELGEPPSPVGPAT